MRQSFQSTLPARGATHGTNGSIAAYLISIHAPRTGSDHVMFLPHTGRHYFNPRSPHGERPHALSISDAIIYHFNPRSPHGERRYADGVFQSLPDISIHAPRTGSDVSKVTIMKRQFLFQSTLPARGATTCWLRQSNLLQYFNPRSPHGERLKQFAGDNSSNKFQSTLPARGATLQMVDNIGNK